MKSNIFLTIQVSFLILNMSIILLSIDNYVAKNKEKTIIHLFLADTQNTRGIEKL